MNYIHAKSINQCAGDLKQAIRTNQNNESRMYLLTNPATSLAALGGITLTLEGLSGASIAVLGVASLSLPALALGSAGVALVSLAALEIMREEQKIDQRTTKQFHAVGAGKSPELVCAEKILSPQDLGEWKVAHADKLNATDLTQDLAKRNLTKRGGQF